MWKVVKNEQGKNIVLKKGRNLHRVRIRTMHDISRWRCVPENARYRSTEEKQNVSDKLLRVVAHSGSLSVLKKLLAKGIAPDGKDKYNDTALVRAVRRGNAQITALLLAWNANPHFKDCVDKTTLLMYSRSARVTRLLLAHGVDIHARDDDGYTALHYASRRGSTEIVRLLLKAGSDVHAKTDLGAMPLHNAATVEEGDVAERICVVRVLIAAGADIHARDNDGYTPLIYAARSGSPGMVAFLLSLGANPDDRVNRGASIVELVQTHIGLRTSCKKWEASYVEIIKMLESGNRK